jgi:hypothetical protein
VRTSISQIALSAGNRARSSAWYQNLGPKPSGGMGPLTGDLQAQILELPELDVSIDWVDGRDAMSQLELVEFSHPEPQLAASDMSHCATAAASSALAGPAERDYSCQDLLRVRNGIRPTMEHGRCGRSGAYVTGQAIVVDGRFSVV